MVVPGTDAIVLRVSRTGGIVRAYSYTILDSTLWVSPDRAPRIARVLAFDEDGGVLSVIDAAGALRQLDLRAGHVSGPRGGKLADLTSTDGVAVYGILPSGAVTRITRTDAVPWTRLFPHSVRNIAPQPDGAVVVDADAANRTIVWRVHPPDKRLLDSAALPRVDRLVRPQVGDRVYFVIGATIAGLEAADLTPTPLVRFDRKVRTVVPTPSGDRLYVGLDSTAGLQIVDRYTSRVRGEVALPGVPADLRMDPLGRYLLARPATGDSVWVIAIGADRLVGTVHTLWTADLPFVGPDGRIALSDGPDVVFVDGDSLHVRRSVPGGAHDYWILIRWNGFRPRPPGLDEPVSFARIVPDSSDSIQMAIRHETNDSGATSAVADSAILAAPATPGPARSAEESTRPSPAPAAPDIRGYLVQFAANLSADNARAIAATIDADGARPRLMPTQRSGVTVYHVVLGPYPTREQADAVGRAAHHPYWVYEGAP
jgi:cell division septation protein DedD